MPKLNQYPIPLQLVLELKRPAVECFHRVHPSVWQGPQLHGQILVLHSNREFLLLLSLSAVPKVVFVWPEAGRDCCNTIFVKKIMCFYSKKA